MGRNQEDLWIDPVPPFTFLNHSCDPTAGIRGTVSVVAMRDLTAGDEITIDYATIEGDPLWEMACCCGAANCRKVVRSIHFLPEAQFWSYLPFVPAYFQRLHRSAARRGVTQIGSGSR